MFMIPLNTRPNSQASNGFKSQYVENLVSHIENSHREKALETQQKASEALRKRPFAKMNKKEFADTPVVVVDRLRDGTVHSIHKNPSKQKLAEVGAEFRATVIANARYTPELPSAFFFRKTYDAVPQSSRGIIRPKSAGSSLNRKNSSLKGLIQPPSSYIPLYQGLTDEGDVKNALKRLESAKKIARTCDNDSLSVSFGEGIDMPSNQDLNSGNSLSNSAESKASLAAGTNVGGLLPLTNCVASLLAHGDQTPLQNKTDILQLKDGDARLQNGLNPLNVDGVAVGKAVSQLVGNSRITVPVSNVSATAGGGKIGVVVHDQVGIPKWTSVKAKHKQQQQIDLNADRRAGPPTWLPKEASAISPGEFEQVLTCLEWRNFYERDNGNIDDEISILERNAFTQMTNMIQQQQQQLLEIRTNDFRSSSNKKEQFNANKSLNNNSKNNNNNSNLGVIGSDGSSNLQMMLSLKSGPNDKMSRFANLDNSFSANFQQLVHLSAQQQHQNLPFDSSTSLRRQSIDDIQQSLSGGAAFADNHSLLHKGSMKDSELGKADTLPNYANSESIQSTNKRLKNDDLFVSPLIAAANKISELQSKKKFSLLPVTDIPQVLEMSRSSISNLKQVNPTITPVLESLRDGYENCVATAMHEVFTLRFELQNVATAFIAATSDESTGRKLKQSQMQLLDLQNEIRLLNSELEYFRNQSTNNNNNSKNNEFPFQTHFGISPRSPPAAVVSSSCLECVARERRRMRRRASPSSDSSSVSSSSSPSRELKSAINPTRERIGPPTQHDGVIVSVWNNARHLTDDGRPGFAPLPVLVLPVEKEIKKENLYFSNSKSEMDEDEAEVLAAAMGIHLHKGDGNIDTDVQAVTEVIHERGGARASPGLFLAPLKNVEVQPINAVEEMNNQNKVPRLSVNEILKLIGEEEKDGYMRMNNSKKASNYIQSSYSINDDSSYLFNVDGGAVSSNKALQTEIFSNNTLSFATDEHNNTDSNKQLTPRKNNQVNSLNSATNVLHPKRRKEKALSRHKNLKCDDQIILWGDMPTVGVTSIDATLRGIPLISIDDMRGITHAGLL